jgi:hypothetical protein
MAITPRRAAAVWASIRMTHVLVDHNKLTLYQITEPLQTTSSATSADPAPYGLAINGLPLNDPIPDTEVDPTTGLVVSSPATGTSALFDNRILTEAPLCRRSLWLRRPPR